MSLGRMVGAYRTKLDDRKDKKAFYKLLLDAFFDQEKVKRTVVNALYWIMKKSLMSKFKSKDSGSKKVLKNLKKASPIKIKK
jgi:hypothetical protein